MSTFPHPEGREMGWKKGLLKAEECSIAIGSKDKNLALKREQVRSKQTLSVSGPYNRYGQKGYEKK